MQTVFDKRHRRHNPVFEVYGGRMVQPFESPERADIVYETIKSSGLGDIIAPRDFGLEPVQRVHTHEYLNFLKNCWSDWKDAGFDGEAIATVMPSRKTGERCPEFIEGKLGYYAASGESAIMDGTWEASVCSANVALTAADVIVKGARAAFALCRPPGHHCMSDKFGGYCYLNNASIAAQYFLDSGSDHIAVLDIDFHHGNGTQEIFYDGNDVLFCSIHGDPSYAYPFFMGYADECGIGIGEGFNHNFPMPKGTGFEAWSGSFDSAVEKIERFSPDRLVVSLGVDTFDDDPQSFFKIATEDFFTIGGMISDLNLPTLFVMEGGYAFGPIGTNVVNVLKGYEENLSNSTS